RHRSRKLRSDQLHRIDRRARRLFRRYPYELRLRRHHGAAATACHSGRRRGVGLMTPAVFSHGDLRLYLLLLLSESPQHGYGIIQALTDRTGGTYTPSAGTIYPRLAKLEEEGLVSKTVDGRTTIYAITDAGRAELTSREGDLA